MGIENKILEFLKTHSCMSTSYIAKYCVFGVEYKEMETRFNNKFIFKPNSTHIQRTYYWLKKLQTRGLIEQVARGIWKIKNNEP